MLRVSTLLLKIIRLAKEYVQNLSLQCILCFQDGIETYFDADTVIHFIGNAVTFCH